MNLLLFICLEIALSTSKLCNYQDKKKELRNIKKDIETLNWNLKNYSFHINLQKFDYYKDVHIKKISNDFISTITNYIKSCKIENFLIPEIENYIVKNRKNGRKGLIKELDNLIIFLYNFLKMFDLNNNLEYKKLNLVDKNELSILFLLNNTYNKDIVLIIEKILNYFNDLKEDIENELVNEEIIKIRL